MGQMLLAKAPGLGINARPIDSALVLLSQKVAAFADENHVFGKIQFSACKGLRWVCQNLVTLHRGFRRTSRV
jgi:hypothetical protein